MKKKTGRKPNPYADLEGEVDGLELSDESDDGLDETLGASKDNDEEEEEVFDVYRSEDESDADSKLDSMEEDLDIPADPTFNIPDAKAWGRDRKSFYNTDYVDKDFLGFDNEEEALDEEREAVEIQKRITKELEGADFDLGLFQDADEVKMRKAAPQSQSEVKESIKNKEKVIMDLTKMSHNELLNVLKTDSPGILNLTRICSDHLAKADNVVRPVLNVIKGSIEGDGVEFLRTYNRLVKLFATNTLFFLYIKSKRARTEGHPVMKRLFELETLLKLMEKTMESLEPDLKRIIANGRALKRKAAMEETEGGNRKIRRARKLNLLRKQEEENRRVQMSIKKLMKLSDGTEAELQIGERAEIKTKDEDRPPESETESEPEKQGDEKRPATYQILKNKGLTPRRKKEVRNPRVKNRNKFKKSVIRRRGQVREVKKELSKYTGELSGINKTVTKSIKLK